MLPSHLQRRRNQVPHIREDVWGSHLPCPGGTGQTQGGPGEAGGRAWGHDSQTWVKLVSSHSGCPMLPGPVSPQAVLDNVLINLAMINLSLDSGLDTASLGMRPRFGQPCAVLGHTASSDKRGRVRCLQLPHGHWGQVLCTQLLHIKLLLPLRF